MSSLPPRLPGLPGFQSDVPPPSLGSAGYTPPAVSGYPVGGLLLSLVSNLDNFDPTFVQCIGQDLNSVFYPDLATRLGTGASSYWGPAPTGFVHIPSLQDRFLLMDGPTHLVKATGGEENHVLTVPELPAHTHAAPSAQFALTNLIGQVAAGAAFGAVNAGAAATNSTGNGTAHNNMPPYITVRAFLRALP